MDFVYVYNTYGGEKKNMGFPTFQAMLDYWQAAIIEHRRYYTNIRVYADSVRASLIEGLIDAEIIETQFPNLDDRFWNLSKIHVHGLQTSAYAMGDVDVTVKGLIEFTAPCMVEQIRAGRSSKHAHLFELPPIGFIPCSGIMAFNDIAIKDQYCNYVIELIQSAKDFIVDYEMLWTVEETSLAYLSQLLQFDIHPITVDYDHRGQRK